MASIALNARFMKTSKARPGAKSRFASHGESLLCRLVVHAEHLLGGSIERLKFFLGVDDLGLLPLPGNSSEREELPDTLPTQTFFNHLNEKITDVPHHDVRPSLTPAVRCGNRPVCPF
jgi:hypothetical protein